MNENVPYAPLHLFPVFPNMGQRRKRACKVKQMDETRGGRGRGEEMHFPEYLQLTKCTWCFLKKKKKTENKIKSFLSKGNVRLIVLSFLSSLI